MINKLSLNRIFFNMIVIVKSYLNLIYYQNYNNLNIFIINLVQIGPNKTEILRLVWFGFGYISGSVWF